MLSRLKFRSGLRRLLLATILFLAGLTAADWIVQAQQSPVTAPGTPLPASGGSQEPGGQKTPPSGAPAGASKSGSASATPANKHVFKPMVIHVDRDFEIARTVGTLLEGNHYIQKPISPEMSQRWLKNYMLTLDYNHLFFLQSDVDEFTAKYGNYLGELLLHNDNDDKAIAPAFEIFNRYAQRVNENVALAQKLLKEKYDFTLSDTYVPQTHKSDWLKDAAASEATWRGLIKSDLLNGLLAKKPTEETVKRLTKRYDSLLRDRQEFEDLDVLEQYLDALCHAYDPHSDYFQPDEAQNFAIQSIDLAVTGIGAVLKQDDGFATIEEIIPGGPADLDKRLQAGDRVLSVGQGNDEPVDAVDMKLNRVVDMIRGRKGTNVHLVILPAGVAESGVHKDIVIKRDVVNIKESHAKAQIIQHAVPGGGTEKIGIIDLPGFYKDTAVDVGKLMIRLKQEQVAGIILDLRNNGGGLLDQAVDLTGLFVKGEPVVQIRRSDGFIDQLGTEDTPQVYSGPLLVMINKASASATEIVAGALQDYGRAVIVGDQSTHGKGTVQNLIPLDQQVPLGFIGDPGKLKMTVQKFYRVAGGSTQQKGVVPDIVLPSFLDALELGETTLPYYLPYDTVPAASYRYLNLTSDYLANLRTASQARVAASPDFNYVRQDIDYFKKKIEAPTLSLNLATRKKEDDDFKALAAARKKDLEARKSSRDKVLELTLDMIDHNLPPAPPVDKKPKLASSDDDSDPGLSDAINNPTDDPQLDEAINIMTDYTGLLQAAGSKLVQAQPVPAPSK